VIARLWRGWVGTDRADEYVEYISRTGIAEYRRTPGNLGAQMWTRDLGDGRTEVLTLSWWKSAEDIRGFAGDDIAQAVFYPEDDDYLVDRETTVTHYEVAPDAPMGS
jgi:heme-degrading monooxygenase HmoA